MSCKILESGTIELYFYDELDGAERDRIATHLHRCRECAGALEDLATIRLALATRPDVSGPPSGEWSAFMERLDAAVLAERSANTIVPFAAHKSVPAVRSYIGLLATAALLAIVTMSVLFVARQRDSRVEPPSTVANVVDPDRENGAVATAGLRAAGEQHFERSKLVVLGLAGRDSDLVDARDWAYERELATSLLNDTRLYRMAAEQNGMTRLAGVMRDLEIVLIETSMAEASDEKALSQIQRLIQKRGLIEKMDSVATVGM